MNLNTHDEKTENRAERFSTATMPPAPIADLLGFSLVSDEVWRSGY